MTTTKTIRSFSLCDLELFALVVKKNYNIKNGEMVVFLFLLRILLSLLLMVKLYSSVAVSIIIILCCVVYT